MAQQEINLETERILTAIRENRCPDCGNWGFAMGPRGGVGRNIFCAQPTCRSGFNIAPVPGGGAVGHKYSAAFPMFAQRIDRGRDCYYPPQIHILNSGRPLCAFLWEPPSEWPVGHAWVGLDERTHATCSDCKAAAKERGKELQEGAE